MAVAIRRSAVKYRIVNVGVPLVNWILGGGLVSSRPIGMTSHCSRSRRGCETRLTNLQGCFGVSARMASAGARWYIVQPGPGDSLWLLSPEGQAVVGESGYVPLPPQ